MHPEESAVRHWVEGRTVEVGCGSKLTPGVTLCLDHTPRGMLGVVGSEEGRTSSAGVAADMASLPLRDDCFDTLVARHILEHSADTLTVLREWRRVARRLVIICPDQHNYPGNTVALDPSHEAAFTPNQLARLLADVGLTIKGAEYPIPQWSFLLVAEAVR